MRLLSGRKRRKPELRKTSVNLSLTARWQRFTTAKAQSNRSRVLKLIRSSGFPAGGGVLSGWKAGATSRRPRLPLSVVHRAIGKTGERLQHKKQGKKVLTLMGNNSIYTITRRSFVQSVVAAVVVGEFKANRKVRPCILLRSSWQVVNIGDIAHTPGVVALLEKHIPDAELILWAPPSLSDEVATMEHTRFPNLKIVKGQIGSDGKASTPELAEAIQRSGLLLHGSGPSFVAEKDVAAFVRHTQKPFGVYGITLGETTYETRALLSTAKFVFFRDSVSLKKAKQDGVKSPVMEFGPDGAFAVDVRNDLAAEEFLQANDLRPGKFVCCIPRLRFTPYWTIKKWIKLDPKRHARNEAMKEHDHAPLRETISQVVRQTDMKVLVCPEDMTQMQVGRENLIDKLPADVLKRVVWREKFWLTDEALSTYALSAG